MQAAIQVNSARSSKPVNHRFARLRVIFLGLLTLFVCICLHEGGHALATLASGGRIVAFEIFSFQPHVRIMDGASGASLAATALRAVSGSGLTLLILGAALSLPSRYLPWIVAEAIALFSGVELLGWCLSAMLHPWWPQPNDAGRFLSLFGSDTCWAIMGTLLVTAGGARMLFSRQRYLSPR